MHIILASNSPRRKELLAGLGIPYDVFVLQGIDESYPSTLPPNEVAEYIACKKAKAYVNVNPNPNDNSKFLQSGVQTLGASGQAERTLDHRQVPIREGLRGANSPLPQLEPSVYGAFRHTEGDGEE